MPKGIALLCLDFGVSFETVQLWVMEIVQGPRLSGAWAWPTCSDKTGGGHSDLSKNKA